MFTEWLKVSADLKKNNFSPQKRICPQCGINAVDYVYVGDSKKNVGYFLIWCVNCNKGIRISRVEIPQGARMIEFNDIESLKCVVPNFEEVYPEK